MFGDCNEISKTLKRMQRSAFKADYRDAGIFCELMNILFTVVIFFILQRRECADTQDVKIFSEYRGRRLSHALPWFRS